MYEVLTLGFHPYQALTNSEVLCYVKSSQTLDKPDNADTEM